ncbi:hypothetical protein U9M48_000192 [Paspalum notatum var. saurae]|uniref:Uncharacterized protein n=1 Tax=Paspalum notatum var. saurae TaxID=547442 RepID=A0AAQ3SHW6_PASNO
MAAAAEDVADPEAEEPFSPSDFLNLAASPPAQDGGDQVLPFIARMLMEEDDNNLYEYPDHTALLQAQQSFADILSDASSSASATNNTAFTVSPPSSAFAGAAWPYDPVQLSQQLLSRTTTTTAHHHNKAAENATTTTMPAAAADEEEEHDLQNRVNMDMLNHAFLKGLEEATKFLPTTNGLLLDLDVSSKGKGWMPSMFQQENTEEQGRGRNRKSRDDHVEADQEPGRSSKLMALEPEEAGEDAQEIAQDAYQSVVDGMQAMGITDSEKSSRKAGSGTEAVDLRTLLIHCAQAMATGRDHLRATELLATIKQRSSPTGDATQRLAHCFARGLEARLAGAPAATAKRASAADLLRAYVQYTEVCCFEIMAFKFSNLVICRALAAGIESGRRKKKVHVVDYGYNYGFQWPCLLSLWSQQEGGPPEMRITAIDLPQPGFRPAARIDATGRCISDFARRHGVPFKFRGVAARWETVRAEDLDIDPDEVLVVNGLLRLEGLSDEGADGIDSPSPRDTVLANIRAMRPDAFVLCVENSSYGSPFFATRFREALFYHAAMFDMMDATTAGAPAAAAAVAAAERVLVEQELLGRRAVNVVACEGTERVERPEAYRQWQVRCGRAGLRQAALDPEIVSAVRKVVELKYHRDFFVDVDDQWLLQGWKGRDEPFSPSVFLDLPPPTPQPHSVGVGGEDLASLSSDDIDMVVLPFISRMLMDDDSDNDDDILYRPESDSDHHALLQAAEQPFAQILSSFSSSAATNTTTGTGSGKLSPASSTAFANDATWPYDPDELSQLLLLSAAQSVGVEASSCCIGQQFFQQDCAAGAEEQGHVTMDLLNQAFLKGMEEGSKFLPTTAANNGDLLSPSVFEDRSSKQGVCNDGDGRRTSRKKKRHHHHDDDGSWWDHGDEAAAAGSRRSAKLMAPEPEGSSEVADGVILKGYEVALEKMHGLSISSGRVVDEKAKSSHGKQGRQRQRSRAGGNDEAVDLRTLLIHCAEAVSAGNSLRATELLRHINQRSSPTGDASQRLAHCFAQGLELRLAGSTPGVALAVLAQPKRASASSSSDVDLLKAYLLYMQVCCFRMAAFKFSHMAIVKAVAASAGTGRRKKKKVHIVDYGVHLGFHWLLLMGAWAASEGGPPEPGFRPAARIKETGRRLSDFARRHGVPFKFRSVVATKWETVSAEHLDIQPDEVLVVNVMFHFEKLMDEGIDGDITSPSLRDTVLANIRKMRPDVFVLCVKSSSYGAPFFVSRFREALFYYSAMFDMMDATAPRDSAERVVVEREFLGRCVVNAIACEGSERVERPETYKQWQARCSRAGLKQLPLSPSTVQCLSERVEEGYHRNFVIDEDQNWLLQGWKGRILYAMSTWAADNPADHPDEPFSPSVFLDLPPTPPNPLGDADDPAAASSDDQVLPFIRRMLMEEAAEDDDILYGQHYYPGHPALLQAEQAFAHILSAGSTATSSSNTVAAAAATTTNSSAVSGSAITNSSVFADATWPYDPDELSSQLLLQLSSTAAGAGLQLSVGEEDRAVPAGDDCVITMDRLNQAFLKGMEEGSKFLPTNTLQPMIFQESSGNGTARARGCKNRHISWEDDNDLEAEAGRRSKLMAPAEPDESGEAADGVFNKAYEVALQKMHGLSISVPGDENEEKDGKGRQRRSRGPGDEAVDLRTLLIHCAEAVNSGNRVGATELLRQIKQRSSPTGDASQRRAHCFAQGLELRLAGGVAVAAAKPCNNKSTSAADFLKAYQLYLQVCCFQMAAFKFSHIAICKATAGRNKVHIVDYGEHHGFQWPLLLGHLADREGGPPEVRITAIGFPQPGFRPAARIDETGRRLTEFARGRGLPFKFRVIVAARWETVRAADVDIQPDEVLVVNGLFHFGRLMDEGVDEDDIESPSPRDMVLANIRDMRPDVFILCVENSSYGAPFFVSRFREALLHYSAMFDMMDATAPRDSAERAVVEEEVLGRCALNAVACEGPERVERPETYKQWQVRCSRAGLRQLPLLPSTVEFLSKRVEEGYHSNFVIDEDQQWLLQGWKGRILYAMSTWAAHV